jgi:hypothetical protein
MLEGRVNERNITNNKTSLVVPTMDLLVGLFLVKRMIILVLKNDKWISNQL